MWVLQERSHDINMAVCHQVTALSPGLLLILTMMLYQSQLSYKNWWDVALCFKPLNQQSVERKVDFLKGYIYSDYGGSKNLIIFHKENSSDLDMKTSFRIYIKIEKESRNRLHLQILLFLRQFRKMPSLLLQSFSR